MAFQDTQMFRLGHDEIKLTFVIDNMTPELWARLSTHKIRIKSPDGQVHEVEAIAVESGYSFYYQYNPDDFTLQSGMYSSVLSLVFDTGTKGKSEHLLSFQIIPEFRKIQL